MAKPVKYKRLSKIAMKTNSVSDKENGMLFGAREHLAL